jgi:transcriptional regulator with XRE-family HTH domain
VHLHIVRMDGRPISSPPEPNYIKAWRELRGYTQEQLGEKIGTTGAVVSLLENGQRSLSTKWLRKIAPALETTPGFLLDHHPDDIPADVMQIWSEIPEGNREQALRVLQTFKLAS